ncbi:MAG: hypothetical protein LBT01_04465 [Spirochaetaceae bacterium]|jgi:hypothetical protein|nr:hypothetical protein [Spirochaetaceae bacterium]
MKKIFLLLLIAIVSLADCAGTPEKTAQRDLKQGGNRVAGQQTGELKSSFYNEDGMSGELKGSLFYDDGTPGRVSYVDMAIKGRQGMTMNRAISKPPYHEEITISQHDVDYALKQVSLDGVITRDADGNVIIIISATHRRVITPSGEITEVFESPDEFQSFFFNYTNKYLKVVKATDAQGVKKSYLAMPLKKGTLKRVYMRVIPYEEVCVIESINYPIQGYAYHEVRALNSFMQKHPDASYLENVASSVKFAPGTKATVHPVEDSYFSFMQGVSSSNFNNKINVYEEQVRNMRSKQDVSEISAAEMDKIFDGSLLNAELIVRKGDAISSSTYDKMR